MAVRDTGDTSFGFWIAGIGLIVPQVFLPLFVWHILVVEDGIFPLVVGIGADLLILDGHYFERETASEGYRIINKRI